MQEVNIPGIDDQYSHKIYAPSENVVLEPGSLPVIRKGYGKGKLKELADACVSTMMEYGGNPFEIIEVLSSIEEMGKSIRKDDRFTNLILEELAKHKGGFITPSGAKVEAMETSVSYDYTVNKDWVELDNQICELTAKRKALEERMKKIPAGLCLVDPETGEALIGPAKSSKSSFKITLAK